MVVVGSLLQLLFWDLRGGSLPLLQALEGPPASFPTCLTWGWEEGGMGEQLRAQRERARTGGGKETGKKCHPVQGLEDLTLGALKKTDMENEVETNRNQESHRN